ncbi:MraY family glycosyltransferase [Methylotetracoccus oryzae]|uniref:MraY family glycosyltransferase n=1 Tax=Methylotetracoccus oryzae TaxID=1919059 RepID=UPI00111997F7|nr:MraY family glycosyltransferase [Methylotetracoccus oryzae]
MSYLKSLISASKRPRLLSGHEWRLGRSPRFRPTVPQYRLKVDSAPAQRTACLLALNVLLVSLTVLSHPLWTSCVTALLLTVTLVWLLELPAAALGLVDKPQGRKAHDCVTPLTGGPAILFAAAIVMLSGWWPATILPFLIVTGLVGAVDDRRGLSARMRLGAMTAILVAMVYIAGHGVTDLGNLFGFGPIELGAAGSLAFTILCGVGLVNAINMADGVDGLAAAHVASSLTALLLAAWLSTGAFPPELPVIIAAVVGFLVVNSRHPFNPRAQAFLGDSGSMILGVCLAWYAISLSQGEQKALPPAAVLWILGLPVIDTLRLMIQRPLKRGVSPFSGARDHLHHILQAHGMTPSATTCTLVAVNIVFCAVGVLGAHFRVPEPALTYSFIAVALLFWTLTPRSPFIGYCGRDVSECPKAVINGCELATACDDGHPNPR